MGLIALPYQEKYLILSHTSKYLLKIYDPASNTVLREFWRAYERVKKAPEKDDRIISGESPTIPDLNYVSDIVNIFTSGDDIWVVTSTCDETKGVLMDVFTSGGVYKDSFYLKLPEPALKALLDTRHSTLDGNALYTISIPSNQDGTCFIRKYLIEK
jgi:hypothetical protein